jgi:hypothetical protein
VPSVARAQMRMAVDQRFGPYADALHGGLSRDAAT